MEFEQRLGFLKVMAEITSSRGYDFNWAIGMEKDNIARVEAENAKELFLTQIPDQPIDKLVADLQAQQCHGYDSVIERLAVNSRFQKIRELVPRLPKQLSQTGLLILARTMGFEAVEKFSSQLIEPCETCIKESILCYLAQKAVDEPELLRFRKSCELLNVQDGELSSGSFIYTLLTHLPPKLYDIGFPYVLKYTARDEDFQRNIIHFATQSPNDDPVRYVVEKLGFDPNTRLKGGIIGESAPPVTALSYAIRSGPKERMPVIAYLCQKGCANVYENGELSPLMHAIEVGNYESFKLVAEHTNDLGYVASEGRSALVLALRRPDGQTKMVNYLLSKGVDPNSRQGFGNEVPLTEVFKTGFKPKMFEALLRGGARLDLPLTEREGAPSRHIFSMLDYENGCVALELVRKYFQPNLQPDPPPDPMVSDVDLA